MGIKVDRWSVRSYCSLPLEPPPTIAAFGMNVPLSIISISSLAGKQGDAGPSSGEDVLARVLSLLPEKSLVSDFLWDGKT
jgi:hypothetical protein